MTPVRILLVDDHTLFRRGLSALLSRDPQLRVVGDAADTGEALRRARELQPAAPQARVLMLTVSEDENDLAAALRGGACGYLLKTIEGDELANAIHRAMQGESVVAEAMTSKLVAAFRNMNTRGAVAAPDVASPTPATRLASLSPREQEILREIALGASNKEIARTLDIAETTVKIHVQHILRKLEISSRVQAAVLAAENAGTGEARS